MLGLACLIGMSLMLLPFVNAVAADEAHIDVMSKCGGYWLAVQGKPSGLRCWYASFVKSISPPRDIFIWQEGVRSYNKPDQANSIQFAGLDTNCNYRMTGALHSLLDIDLAGHQSNHAIVLSDYDKITDKCRITVSYEHLQPLSDTGIRTDS